MSSPTNGRQRKFLFLKPNHRARQAGPQGLAISPYRGLNPDRVGKSLKLQTPSLRNDVTAQRLAAAPFLIRRSEQRVTLPLRTGLDLTMTCSSCAFYNDAAGECRRNAPIPVGRRQYAQWPKVRKDDWCGQRRAAQTSQTLKPTDENGGTALGPRALAAE